MVRRGDQEAARRPPSIPGLSRRSGRIPALPYPPIKLSYYKTNLAKPANKKTSILAETAINPGGWGAKPPSWRLALCAIKRRDREPRDGPAKISLDISEVFL